MMILFWDKDNDELELLGEDGFFYLYGQDNVARDQGKPDSQWQYWLQLFPMSEITPLNEWQRYEYMHPETGEWLPWEDVDVELLTAVHRHARDPDWRHAKDRA